MVKAQWKAAILLCVGAAILSGCKGEEARQGTPSAEAEHAAFWRLLESATLPAPDCADRTAALHARLLELEADSIRARFYDFHELMRQSYRRELWAALQHNSNLEDCGDDCFESVRAWLILQGRAQYSAALRDPWAYTADNNVQECPGMLRVFFAAYHERSGAYMRLDTLLQGYELH